MVVKDKLTYLGAYCSSSFVVIPRWQLVRFIFHTRVAQLVRAILGSQVQVLPLVQELYINFKTKKFTIMEKIFDDEVQSYLKSTGVSEKQINKIKFYKLNSWETKRDC